MYRTVFAALILWSAHPMVAQKPINARLDSFFRSIESGGKGMGTISLFQNGMELYHFGAGYANLGKRIKPTENTKYRIGSITKTFTATVIMQLVDEKLLSLDSKLADYFPDVPGAGQITVENLLRHHSGLDDKHYLLWQYRGKAFKPGKKPRYANCNYVLLSQIAEKVAQKPFGEMLAERIFRPCGLKNTYYGNKPDSIHDEALSYRRLPHWQATPPNDLDSPAGAGAIVSTPADINRFFHFLFTGKLVSQEALKQMKHTVSGYGMGMMQVAYYDKTGYSHSGAIDAFESTAVYFPAQNFSIAYCSNGTNMPLNDILIAVLGIYFGQRRK